MLSVIIAPVIIAFKNQLRMINVFKLVTFNYFPLNVAVKRFYVVIFLQFAYMDKI